MHSCSYLSVASWPWRSRTETSKANRNLSAPYIYHLQGRIYLKNKEFKKSLDCFNEAITSFEKSSNNN